MHFTRRWRHATVDLISVTDLIRQVSQLLRAELEELADVVWATMEPIKLCDEEW